MGNVGWAAYHNTVIYSSTYESSADWLAFYLQVNYLSAPYLYTSIRTKGTTTIKIKFSPHYNLNIPILVIRIYKSLAFRWTGWLVFPSCHFKLVHRVPGAGMGIRTPMVAHKNLNLACLPISSYPLFSFILMFILNYSHVVVHRYSFLNFRIF